MVARVILLLSLAFTLLAWGGSVSAEPPNIATATFAFG